MCAYRRTTIVLDALDECDEESRLNLIKIFDRLTNDISNLKIFISSRRDDDIKRRLELKTNLGVDVTNNQEDIRKFVLAKLEEGQLDRRKPFTDELRTNIVDILFEQSNGM
jgi:hypothetical protein